VTARGEGLVLGPEGSSIETARRGELLELRAVRSTTDERASVLLNRAGARELAALLSAFAREGRP